MAFAPLERISAARLSAAASFRSNTASCAPIGSQSSAHGCTQHSCATSHNGCFVGEIVQFRKVILAHIFNLSDYANAFKCRYEVLLQVGGVCFRVGPQEVH